MKKKKGRCISSVEKEEGKEEEEENKEVEEEGEVPLAAVAEAATLAVAAALVWYSPQPPRWCGLSR